MSRGPFSLDGSNYCLLPGILCQVRLLAPEPSLFLTFGIGRDRQLVSGPCQSQISTVRSVAVLLSRVVDARSMHQGGLADFAFAFVAGCRRQ
eukprot:COSAG02_NODE_1383_length_12965_cov_60.828463_5_plen_92_part_00